MAEFQQTIDILIRLMVYGGSIFILANIIWFILKEFGKDILKGNMNIGDYINLAIGVMILLFIIINAGGAIGYATLKSVQKMKPYVAAIQDEIVTDVRAIIGNTGGSGSVITVDGDTTYDSLTIFATPTVPYLNNSHGQPPANATFEIYVAPNGEGVNAFTTEDGQGGGMPVISTPTPSVPLNVTVIPNGDPTLPAPNTDWKTGDDYLP